MGEVTEKTKRNARVRAHELHGALEGLVVQFEANGLDPAPVAKAAKALAPVAKAIQDELDEERRRKANYHASVGALDVSELDRLRKENEELRSQLSR